MSIRDTANALATAAALPTGQRNFAITSLALVDASGNVVFDAVKIKAGDSAALTALRALLGITPAGTLVAYAGSALPGGWLFCDGAAVSRATYAGLFTAIGTTYGSGNGTTTFNVPDARGRTLAGLDNMGSGAASRLTGATLAAALGAETHTLDVAEMPAHTHLYNRGDAGPTFDDNHDGSTDPAYSTQSGDETASTGGGGAHANVQPTLCLNYLIKT